ncbi:MAG: hypothetical protein WC687_04365 [Patescibacteria group bacterium]|jgi:hypothetical protein
MKTLNGFFFAAIILCLTGAAYAQGQGNSGKDNPRQEGTKSTESVIIDAKWGTESGQFGALGPREKEMLGFSDNVFSLAIGCDGFIYILDPLNNRIQKFDSNGKHLKNIAVDGCVDEDGKSCIYATQMSNGRTRLNVRDDLWAQGHSLKHGVNILIDSKNTLYYYCVDQDSGEIWEFRNDSLISRSTSPVSKDIRSGLGLTIDSGTDSLWLYNVREKGRTMADRHFEVRDHTMLSTPELKEWRTRQQKTRGTKDCSPAQKRKAFKLQITEDGLQVVHKLQGN